jgi:hypothetical protein
VLAFGAFAIVNAAALRRRAPWAAGISAGRCFALPQARAANVAVYTPSPDLVAASVKPLAVATGRNTHEHVEGRYGATWRDIRAISAALYAETSTPLPSVLQAAWNEQRTASRSYGIVVSPVAGDLGDYARHAVSGGIAAAKSFSQPMPVAVVSTTVDDIASHVAAVASLISHCRRCGGWCRRGHCNLGRDRRRRDQQTEIDDRFTNR